MKKILIVYSGQASKKPRFPLSSLVLASWLRKNGYDPEILDLRLNEYIDLDFGKYSCICIGSMSGAELYPGIELSKYIKAKNPNMPIIWGGQHMSATQIKEGYMDSIIIGEGELALLNALKDLENNQLKPMYHQQLIDMDRLDLPAYDLIDITEYLDYTDEWSYEPSRGCPHNCLFCYVEYFHKRKWRSKSAEKIINEIKQIVRKYKPKKIKIIGDNFFTNKDLALKVCDGIKDLKIKWSSTCRADYLADYSEDDMKRTSESGCWMLQIGCESGSQEILDYLKKGISPTHSVLAVAQCVRWNILPLVSFVIGIPNETRTQLKETLKLYDTVTAMGATVNGIFILHPYCGTAFYEDALKLGYKAPANIDEWSRIELRRKRLPWHGNRGLVLETIATISRFKFFIKHSKRFTKKSIEKKTGVFYPILLVGLLPFRLSAYLRWKLRFFRLGYDWKLFRWIMSRFTEIY